MSREVLRVLISLHRRSNPRHPATRPSDAHVSRAGRATISGHETL